MSSIMLAWLPSYEQFTVPLSPVEFIPKHFFAFPQAKSDWYTEPYKLDSQHEIHPILRCCLTTTLATLLLSHILYMNILQEQQGIFRNSKTHFQDVCSMRLYDLLCVSVFCPSVLYNFLSNLFCSTRKIPNGQHFIFLSTGEPHKPAFQQTMPGQ